MLPQKLSLPGAAAGVTIAAVITLSACSGSPAPQVPASGAVAASAPPLAAPSSTATISVGDCGSQLKAWLAEGDTTGINGNTNEHDIQAIEFDAHTYTEKSGSPPGGVQFLANAENGLATAISNLGGATPPPCADPNSYFLTFTTNASNAGNDTAGDPQTEQDMQSVLSGFTKVDQDFSQFAGVTVPDSDPKLSL